MSRNQRTPRAGENEGMGVTAELGGEKSSTQTGDPGKILQASGFVQREENPAKTKKV